MIKSIKSKANNETRSLKNIIDSKEAEITSYQSNQMALYAEVKKLKNENEELRFFKIRAVEEAKKEADSLMIDKCLKYENEIREVKEDNKKLAKQIEDLKK
jgi:nucleoside-triphosphatase THEP1